MTRLEKSIGRHEPNSGNMNLLKLLCWWLIGGPIKINQMSSPFAILFCKTERCPTSQALLEYCGSLMRPGDEARVEHHLKSCDFCNAELQLLTCCRTEAEEYSFVEMPAPIRRLAEDLLKRSAVPFLRFAELAENPHVSH